MPAASPPTDSLSEWLYLAARWQSLAVEWASFWARAAIGWDTGVASRAGHAAPAGTGVGFDWHALLDQYEMQLRAAWRALAPDAGELPPLPESERHDKRFAGPEWCAYPYFDLVRQAYLLTAHFARRWAERQTLEPAQKRRLLFTVRQMLDATAPSNYLSTNPEVARLALQTHGESLRKGVENLVADTRRGRIAMTDESAFAIGRNIAVTPGDVVFRNPLIELIQYRPSTARVHSRPLVIVPPCINKYYILDLQADNSFVRHAVEQGHTVFMVSWRNIPPELGGLTWDDYLESGVLAAFDAAADISGSRSLNALGFCVGGTLLAGALAVLAARGDDRVASATFLTTMLDFADPGEIGVFVSEELLVAREPALLAGERIHGGELATAFASLRANELVWNYVVDNYLKGKTPPAFDLLYWNSDSANLPGPWYVYYLRNMYLGNRLRDPGALTMLGERVDLRTIEMPSYVFAAREDHIVPWRSAFASARLLGGSPTFVLGASGHIAGAINPPSRDKRNYWVGEKIAGTLDPHALDPHPQLDPPAPRDPHPQLDPPAPRDPHAGLDPEAWLERAESRPGSWWRHWSAWIESHGGELRAAPKHPGNVRYPSLGPAPGTYVREPSGPVRPAALGATQIPVAPFSAAPATDSAAARATDSATAPALAADRKRAPATRKRAPARRKRTPAAARAPIG